MTDHSNRFWKFVSVAMPAFLVYTHLRKVMEAPPPISEAADLPYAIAFSGWLLYALAQLYRNFAGAQWPGVATEVTTKLVVRKSLLVEFAGWIFMIGWLIGGVLLFLQDDKSAFTSVMATCLLLTGLVGCVTFSLGPRFRLILSRDGFDFSPCQMGEVAWADVADVSVKEMLGRPYGVQVELRNAEIYFARSKHSWIGRFLFLRRKEAGRVVIGTDDLGIPPEELRKAMDARRMASAFGEAGA